MSSPSQRQEMDLMKLMMSDYKVEMINDGMREFYVHFHGPRETYCEKYAKAEDVQEELNEEDYASSDGAIAGHGQPVP